MTDLDARLTNQLLDISRQMRSCASQAYGDPLQMTDVTAGLLKLLAREETRHWTQAKLAEVLSISESSLCSAIEKLRSRGLLDRRRQLTDRRKTQLVLTPAGFEQLARIVSKDDEIEAELRSSLREAQQHAVSIALAEIQTVLRGIDFQNLAAGRAA